MKIKIIVAVANNNAIGEVGDKIPWEFHPDDMKIFSNKTKSEGATVVMGRKTFLSLPKTFRPLPSRTNLVLTRNINWSYEGIEVFYSKDVLLEVLKQREVECLWVCGGAEVYKEFIELAEELHVSRFDISPQSAVAFFPSIDYAMWKEIESKVYVGNANSPQFTHKIYKRNGYF